MLGVVEISAARELLCLNLAWYHPKPAQAILGSIHMKGCSSDKSFMDNWHKG